jgi:hypothetical protein
MDRFRFLKKQKNLRDYRHGLVQFFEALFLNLSSGYELSYAWKETLLALSKDLPQGLSKALSATEEDQSMALILRHLSENYAVLTHRIWFQTLRELYESGAGLSEAVRGIALTLRKEHERDLENHIRNLPTKLNVCMILFFFPPTLALLFFPLLLEILRAF